YPKRRSLEALLPRSPSPVGRRSRKPLGYPSQVQILPWAFSWRDQCNSSKLSPNPNPYDPRLTGFTENTEAVLAFHPPVVLQDRFEFGVPCRIHDGLGSRAFTEALRHQRVDGLLHERRTEGLQPSEFDARVRLDLLLQLPQHGRRPVIQRPVLPAHRDQRLMQLISPERLAFCHDVPTVTDRYTLSSTLTETPTITFTSTPTDTSRPSWTVRLPATVTVFEIETPGPTPNVQGEKKQVPPVAVDGVK